MDEQYAHSPVRRVMELDPTVLVAVVSGRGDVVADDLPQQMTFHEVTEFGIRAYHATPDGSDEPAGYGGQIRALRTLGENALSGDVNPDYQTYEATIAALKDLQRERQIRAYWAIVNLRIQARLAREL